MSVEAMAAVLHHAAIGGTDKLILIGIANHEGDGGAFPTIATLAKYANVSHRSVQHSICKLMKAGLIEVDYRRGGTVDTRNDRRPNRYRVLVRCPVDCDGTTNHRVTSASPRDADEVKPSAQRGEACFANEVKPVSPKPSIEPSMNQSRAFTVEQAFASWYSAFPVKKGKGAALRAYRAALKLASEEDLLLALKRQAPEIKKRSDAGYALHPASWLNARRWEDGPDPGPVPEQAYVPPLDPADQLAAALARMDPTARAAYEDAS